MDGQLQVSVYDFDSSSTIDVTNRTISVSVTRNIDSVSSANVQVRGLDDSHELDALTVAYGDELLFSGTIESQEDDLRGGETLRRFSSWQAKDAALRLENRLANKIYRQLTVEAIIADLLETYPCGIANTYVQPTNRVIDEIAFPYVNLYDCVKQLAEIVGWRWYVDADHHLHFFDQDEGVGDTVFSTTIGDGLARNIRADSISMETQVDDRSANRVWVIGARQASAAYIDQSWMGDGANSLWSIAYEPNDPEVYENGVPKTVEPDQSGSPESDYRFDRQNKVLRRTDGPLPSGVALLLKYRPTTQIIDYFEDAAAVAQYGVYEKAIKDKTIQERMAARARARAELKRRSGGIRSMSFETLDRQALCGKRYRIVIPELGVDSWWLCTGVQTDIAAPDFANVSQTLSFEEVV